MVVTLEKPKDPEEATARVSNLENRVAELAYYKAEQRGFAPGHEMEYWLEAEQECQVDESNNLRLISGA